MDGGSYGKEGGWPGAVENGSPSLLVRKWGPQPISVISLSRLGNGTDSAAGGQGNSYLATFDSLSPVCLSVQTSQVFVVTCHAAEGI